MNMRTIAALGILYVAFAGVPDIKLPDITPQPVTPAVKEPTVLMQNAVADVADICKSMEAFDRLVWMATWEDAATIIAGEDDDVEVTFENTLGFRAFISSVFDVAWRRLANASGKYRGLDAAVEKAFKTILGNEVRPFSEMLAEDSVELCEALAWAGARGE
jgi:hypothetical protein